MVDCSGSLGSGGHAQGGSGGTEGRVVMRGFVEEDGQQLLCHRTI